MRLSGLTGIAALALFAQTASALMVYESGTSTDNTYNTTPPSNGAPWQYVANLGPNNASAVYLGYNFMLTANHVNLINPVILNGGTYSLDSSFTAMQIGAVDLKVFKILGSPGLAPMVLTGSTDNDLGKPATLIGWGVGKGSIITASGSNVGWNWGNDSTRAQRWGTNVTLGTTVTDGTSIYLQTAFNPALGPDVPSATLGDSGSALFEYLSGTWKLAGVPADVDTGGASYYADSPNNSSGVDYTYSIEISQYSRQIEAIIAPATPPMPVWGYVVLGTSLFFMAARYIRARRL